ncbi:hypothetical protein DICPUDRAFT_25197 [Dictyostelium purpureum]|uniref:Uncharacterized protein n=1 Tax=Dictyostelium purpureum TaxID=5786 RepID=F0Z6R4_DICPU|nr:uncharacterized protein DICPUDRAFT_25197 [Dictyostelium purpureum]EGC40407.1 hypothetical protein DICPUDRAFT_25197 [Dictyostelium purpureum]|eukprot:XP_003283158.1 hypothetical protein DICPUDRAFT_25197 [Dictyostelium purpureum]
MVYYDLNVDASLPEAKLKNILLLHTKLGYDSVALTHTVDGKISYKDICKIKKIEIKEEDLENSTVSGWMNVGSANKTLKQYTRLEVICKTMADFNLINSNNPVVNSYDIVSIVPVDPAIFNAACNSNDIDIITVNTQSKFLIKPERVRQAIAKGIFLELLYTNVFHDKDRPAFFNMISSLVRSSFGKNIILSSSGKSQTTLRSPYDISNLGHLFGLTFDQAKASVSKHPHSAVLHAITRKTKGTAIVSDPSLLKDLELWKIERKEDTQPTGNLIPHNKHKDNKDNNDNNNNDEINDEEILELEEETLPSKQTATTTTSTTTKKQPIVKSNKKQQTQSSTLTQSTKMDLDDGNKRKRE